MRVNIYKPLKRVLIVIIIFLFVISTYRFYVIFSNTQLMEQKIPFLNYNNIANVDYKVYLKPNDLYHNNTIEKDQVYISEFVDNIKTTFEYEFNGSKEVKLQGEYDINAIVTSTISKGFDTEDITIWQRTFPLVSRQTFTINSNTHSIVKNLSINLDEYSEFAKMAKEISKISSDIDLKVIMNIKVSGIIDNKNIEENITPNIVIPLNTPMFEITTNNVDIPGAIEETIQLPVPVNKTQVIIYSVILGILVLALIFLIFFTVPTPKKDPLEKELNNIFKKHGDRLVALTSIVDISNAKYVRSIGDLVRLADEINKPILYRYSDDYKEINKFFVSNGDEVYVLDLTELIPVEEVIQESEQLTVNNEQ